MFCLVQAKPEEPVNCIQANAGLPVKLSHLQGLQTSQYGVQSCVAGYD